MTTRDYTSDEVAEKVVATLRPVKYSTEKPEDYSFARRMFADQWGVGVSELTFRINGLADLWRDERSTTTWPTGTEMLAWDTAVNSIATYGSGASLLPFTFTLIDEAGGEQRYVNDPVKGLVPRPTEPQTTTGDLSRTSPFTDEAQAARRGPAILESDLPDILAGLSPASDTRTSGRGSGRTARAFDRRQLAEAATDRWRGFLLEEPDDTGIDTLVGDYIKEANAFWMKEAGSLDFDTFVTDRIRNQERWHFLYDKKPEFQSESEYMGGFRQVAGQFGLSARGELAAIESGASTGAGLAGFGERVGRTAEARAINSGAFSQRFAASMAQTGIGRT